MSCTGRTGFVIVKPVDCMLVRCAYPGGGILPERSAEREG